MLEFVQAVYSTQQTVLFGCGTAQPRRAGCDMQHPGRMNFSAKELLLHVHTKPHSISWLLLLFFVLKLEFFDTESVATSSATRHFPEQCNGGCDSEQPSSHISGNFLPTHFF